MSEPKQSKLPHAGDCSIYDSQVRLCDCGAGRKPLTVDEAVVMLRNGDLIRLLNAVGDGRISPEDCEKAFEQRDREKPLYERLFLGRW